jgi:SNF family Na+-dependent transporter
VQCGVAWPLFTYELIFGQYISKCNVDAWPAVHPRWKGLGFAQFMLLFIIQTYMQVVVAYTLPYIKASCIEPLPYSDEVHGKTLNSYLQLFIIVVLSRWFVLNPSSNVLSLYIGEKKYWEKTYVLGKHPDPMSFKGLGGFDGEVWAALLSE